MMSPLPKAVHKVFHVKVAPFSNFAMFFSATENSLKPEQLILKSS
jgi:hypothetical protein